MQMPSNSKSFLMNLRTKRCLTLSTPYWGVARVVWNLVTTFV